MATEAQETPSQDMSRKRRQSTIHGQDMTGPVIRRMSRLEPRLSIQQGSSSRRMSYASRSVRLFVCLSVCVCVCVCLCVCASVCIVPPQHSAGVQQ